jgi:hypothetical protein
VRAEIRCQTAAGHETDSRADLLDTRYQRVTTPSSTETETN